MIQSLVAKKSSQFGRDEWLSEPWEDEEKGLEQRLFDQGFALGALFEQSEKMQEMANGLPKLETLISLLRSCNKLHGTLLDLEKEQSIPYEIQGSVQEQRGLLEGEEMAITQTLLAIQLCVTSMGNLVCSKLQDVMACHPEIQTSTLMTLCNDVERHSNRASRLGLARKILGVVPQYLSSTQSVLGASRAILPLKCAFLEFGNSEIERRQVCRLLEQLTSNKGLRFSAAIDTSLVAAVTREELMQSNSEMLTY